MAAGATVAGLAALTALVLVLQVASIARREVRMGLLTTSRHQGPSDLAIDKQLRADIVRLKVGIDNAGANHGNILKRTRANLANLANLSVANTAAARRSQSEASVRSMGDANMEKEMDAMRRELKSIKDELSDTRHAQRPFIGLAMSDASLTTIHRSQAKPCIPGKGDNCLPTVEGKDKKHCLFPLVWARGKCESSPRASFKQRTPAQIRERGIACAAGGETTSCLEFERAERQQQQRELNQYELDLRKSSDFHYQPHERDRHSGSGSGVSCLQRLAYDMTRVRGLGFRVQGLGCSAWRF
jgi:hypothetical protein